MAKPKKTEPKSRSFWYQEYQNSTALMSVEAVDMSHALQKIAATISAGCKSIAVWTKMPVLRNPKKEKKS